MQIDELCHKYGVHKNTPYRGKHEYDGMTPSEVCRLKVLVDENTKLKRLVADLSLDCQILKDALGREREACGQAEARDERAGHLPGQ